MPKFTYKAINAKGRPVRGVIAAANEADLFNRLSAGGMALVDCKEVTEGANRLQSLTMARIRTRDLVQLFLHLEQLQKAGVPLLEALSDVRDTSDSARLRDVMSDVYNEVAEGSALSAAMASHPNVFEAIAISLVAAGEETGNLSESFSQLISHLKWTDEMDNKVKKATRYPKVLVGVVLLVIFVMMNYVVPEVTGFLKEMGQELPGMTVALIATSNFVVNYFLYIMMALVVIYILLRIGRAVSDAFKYYTDYIVLRLPGIGAVVRKISLSRFCSTFSVLFGSGLEILRCLEAAQRTVSNVVIADALQTVREQVQEGSPLSTAMNVSGEFPSLVVRMIRIGEESGNLTHVLHQVSEFYDRDVNDAVDAMISMIEPALTVVLGGMMLWIAAAVFGPIYNSFGAML